MLWTLVIWSDVLGERIQQQQKSPQSPTVITLQSYNTACAMEEQPWHAQTVKLDIPEVP